MGGLRPLKIRGVLLPRPKKHVKCTVLRHGGSRSLQNCKVERQDAPRWLQDAPRWPHEAPRCLQDGLKGLRLRPEWLQDASRLPQEASRRLQDRPQTLQDASKTASRMQKIAKNTVFSMFLTGRRCCSQDAPRRSPEASKLPSDCNRISQDCSQAAPEAPGCPQDRPRWPSKAPGCPQEATKRPQDCFQRS